MHAWTHCIIHAHKYACTHAHTFMYIQQTKKNQSQKTHKSKRKANWDEGDQQRREWDQGGQWELGIIKIYHTSMETKQNTKFSIINVY